MLPGYLRMISVSSPYVLRIRSVDAPYMLRFYRYGDNTEKVWSRYGKGMRITHRCHESNDAESSSYLHIIYKYHFACEIKNGISKIV